MDNTAQILFEYLKDIIYRPAEAKLDLDVLPADFRKLGMGMQQLAEWVLEEREFAKAMAKGDLSKEPPKVENILAASMKELQGALRHLAWQTQQVAKGDFSQRVDFMGDFSRAFNSMTAQLSERTESLVQEKKRVELMNRELEKNLELLLALTNYTNNMIFVISEEDKENIFQNRPAEIFSQASPTMSDKLLQYLMEWGLKNGDKSEKWEIQIPLDTRDECIFYGVESFYIVWSATPAIVHIVTDDTQRKMREKLIYNMAYTDALTGLNNRLYAMDRLESFVKEEKTFLLSVVDVDYLKYCNDNYGHSSGDEYLKNVANVLKNMRCEVCRVGGDEFYVLAEGEEEEIHDRQLSYLREFLMAQKDRPYPQSFSFATVLIEGGIDVPLEQYIRDVDEKMYEYKRKNKKQITDGCYHDNRL